MVENRLWRQRNLAETHCRSFFICFMDSSIQQQYILTTSNKNITKYEALANNPTTSTTTTTYYFKPRVAPRRVEKKFFSRRKGPRSSPIKRLNQTE